MTGPVEDIEARFPKLPRDGYRVTSPPDDAYNCVAWIARDTQRWWAPGVDGYYWPEELGDGDSLMDFVRLFEHLGFSQSPGGAREDGVEKIAIYGAGREFDHVAFQREDGTWSSKLGQLGDVKHDTIASIQGTGPFEYGPVIVYMKRGRQPHPLAETGLILL